MLMGPVFATFDFGCELASLSCQSYNVWKVLGGGGACVAGVQVQEPANCGKGEGKSKIHPSVAFGVLKPDSHGWAMAQWPAKPSSAHPPQPKANRSHNAPSESSRPFHFAVSGEQPASGSTDLILSLNGGDRSGQKGKTSFPHGFKWTIALRSGRSARQSTLQSLASS